MTGPNRMTFAALAFAIGVACAALAQEPSLKISEERPGLFKKAKIAPADAQKTAQAKFPAAKIKSGELENEAGKLIYTFDIQQAGVKGIEEVNIDAMTGAIISTTHEAPPAPKAKPKPPTAKPPAH